MSLLDRYQLTASQKTLLKNLRKAGGSIEMVLMDKEEIQDANKLVKIGLVWKGTAITRQANRQYTVSSEGEYYLDELEDSE